jgi:hypothetical protein
VNGNRSMRMARASQAMTSFGAMPDARPSRVTFELGQRSSRPSTPRRRRPEAPGVLTLNPDYSAPFDDLDRD